MVRYAVKRTELSKRLPLYIDYRNGRTKIVTILRNIQGDIQSLVKDLEQVIPRQHMYVNKNTQQIEFKGKKVDMLRSWLSSRGF